METTNYNKQAEDFLTACNTTITIKFLRNDYHFEGDKDKRDIYLITLTRGNRRFVFAFGQSIMNSQYYQDINIKERTYTLNGGYRTGNYKILDIDRYQSFIKLIKGTLPTAYDILACLTKYDPGTFEDFCDNFGYDRDSRSAKKTYKAVVKEWNNVSKLFNDSEIELLQEI